jgi:hypothetical protein
MASSDQSQQCFQVYLIKEREFIKTNESILKLGRTKVGIMNRGKGYPKGSQIIAVLPVNDDIMCENALKMEFNKKFKQRHDIGTEYFEGIVSQMCLAFSQIVLEHNRTAKKLSFETIYLDDENDVEDIDFCEIYTYEDILKHTHIDEIIITDKKTLTGYIRKCGGPFMRLSNQETDFMTLFDVLKREFIPFENHETFMLSMQALEDIKSKTYTENISYRNISNTEAIAVDGRSYSYHIIDLLTWKYVSPRNLSQVCCIESRLGGCYVANYDSNIDNYTKEIMSILIPKSSTLAQFRKIGKSMLTCSGNDFYFEDEYTIAPLLSIWIVRAIYALHIDKFKIKKCECSDCGKSRSVYVVRGYKSKRVLFSVTNHSHLESLSDEEEGDGIFMTVKCLGGGMYDMEKFRNKLKEIPSDRWFPDGIITDEGIFTDLYLGNFIKYIMID